MSVKSLAQETPKFGQYNDSYESISNIFNGVGYLSIGGTKRIDYMVGSVSLENKLVVDLGSGLGGPAKHLATRHNAQITCVEVDPSLVTASQKLISQWGLTDRISVIESSFAHLPFDDNSVDVIFSKEVIIHIINKQELFEELYRILKPGGTIIIMDWMKSEGPASDLFLDRNKKDGLDLNYIPLDSYLKKIHHARLLISECTNASSLYLADLQKRTQQLDTDKELSQQVEQVMGKKVYTERYHGWKDWAQILESEEMYIYKIILKKP